MMWRFRVPKAALESLSLWTLRTNTGTTMLNGAGSHEFDRAQFLTGLEFARVAGRLGHVTAPEHPDDRVHDGFTMLADLSHGVASSFFVMATAGQAEWRAILVGQDGSLVVQTDSVARQRHDEEAPVPLAIPAEDAAPTDLPLLQHTWNRLIADFVTAVRRGDVAHATVPHLPAFSDGLRLREVFAAVERSDAERRWVDVGEEGRI